MKDKKEFYNLLTELDGQSFAEYQQLVGDFDFSRYVIKCASIDFHQTGMHSRLLILEQ